MKKKKNKIWWNVNIFTVDFFLTHTSGFNSAHKGAKMVANLHVTIRGKKYQECLTVISSNLLISEANKKTNKNKYKQK